MQPTPYCYLLVCTIVGTLYFIWRYMPHTWEQLPNGSCMASPPPPPISCWWWIKSSSFSSWSNLASNTNRQSSFPSFRGAFLLLYSTVVVCTPVHSTARLLYFPSNFVYMHFNAYEQSNQVLTKWKYSLCGWHMTIALLQCNLCIIYTRLTKIDVFLSSYNCDIPRSTLILIIRLDI